MSEVILVPGLLCDQALWQPQLEALGAAGHRPQVSTAQFDHASIDAMAQALLADAPPRFALAGLSMGGYVAMAVMRLAPQRVERLALLDTSGRADQPEQIEFRRQLVEQTRNDQFAAAVDTLLPLLLGAAATDTRSPLATAVRDMALRVGAEAFIRQQTAIMGRIDARAGLSQVRCPTLVICGQQDHLTPPELAQEITACVSNAHLRLISDCGHLSTLEQPQAVNRALTEWLST